MPFGDYDTLTGVCVKCPTIDHKVELTNDGHLGYTDTFSPVESTKKKDDQRISIK